MWCNGLKSNDSSLKRHDSHSDIDDEENDPLIPIMKKRKTTDDREERVSRILQQLKEKHKDRFSNFQLRIWSEMIVGETHSSLEDPPTSSMFERAGGKGKKANSITLPDAISQMSTAISSIAYKAPPTATCSPIKSIDMRSKCYKQLSEINNLRVVGILSEEEYAVEKCAVMDALKKL